MMMRSLSGLVAVVFLAWAGTAHAQWAQEGYHQGNIGQGPELNEYQLDDGVAENSIGLTSGGSFAWLTKYTAQPVNRTIVNIRIAFGTPLTITGMPVTAYLWSDPNQDGNPSDAVVLQSSPGVAVGHAGVPINSPTFVNFPITPTTIPAGNTFFVGVAMNNHLAGQFPAAIDQTAPLPGAGVTWAAFVSSPGTINPNSLGTGQNLTDFFTLSSSGLHGKWLIRADAVAVPEPMSLALCGLGGLLALRRRH